MTVMESKERAIRDIVRKMTASQRAFAVNLYRWALEDSEREFSQRFPFLHRLKSTSVGSYLEFLRGLASHERNLFRVAMVKSAHQAGCFLANDLTTDTEQVLLDRYRARNIEYDPLLGPVAVARGAGVTLASDLDSDNKKYLIDRRILRAALSKELFPILGNSVQSFRGNVERYSTPVGKWKLHTWVDTGKRYSQFSYNHTVTARQNVDLTEGMSILVWLGIAPTDWDLLTNDADIRSAAKLVAELCAHFIVAVSNMQRKRQRRTFVSRR